MTEQRLNKSLWCVRLAKTRTGAARLVAAGKVRINGERALKPSQLVHTGDVVTATPLGGLKVLRVIDVTERRVSANIAETLYEDLTPEDGVNIGDIVIQAILQDRGIITGDIVEFGLGEPLFPIGSNNPRLPMAACGRH